jgi:hypothetical protein
MVHACGGRCPIRGNGVEAGIALYGGGELLAWVESRRLDAVETNEGLTRRTDEGISTIRLPPCDW